MLGIIYIHIEKPAAQKRGEIVIFALFNPLYFSYPVKSSHFGEFAGTLPLQFCTYLPYRHL